MRSLSASTRIVATIVLLAAISCAGVMWLARPKSATGLTREQLKEFIYNPGDFCPDESDYYDVYMAHHTWIFRGKCQPEVAKAWLEKQCQQDGLLLGNPASGTPFPSPVMSSTEPSPHYSILYDNSTQNTRRSVWIGYNEKSRDWFYMKSD